MGRITTLSEEEIKMVSKSPSQELKEAAAKTGDPELMALVEQYTEMRSAADISARTWLTHTMSVLYEHAGPEALQESLLRFFGPNYANAGAFWELDFHDRVMSMINNIRQGLDSAIIVLDEDDEKLRFTMDPCMSGQRLKECGLYEEPSNCVKCAAHNITAGREDFPIYCTHNPIMDIASINACGYPNNVTDYPDDMCSCSCVYVVYKRKEDIPEYYYTRIGRKKPE